MRVPAESGDVVRIDEVIRPLIVGVVWITAASLMREPAKLRAQAVIVGAAAGAYLNGASVRGISRSPSWSASASFGG
jgi:hypothetical protein